MILYFNDYKLIYIITMMGKINNIQRMYLHRYIIGRI